MADDREERVTLDIWGRKLEIIHRNDIRYSPQVASHKLNMHVYEFLDCALKGEVAMVRIIAGGGVSRAEPELIQWYLNNFEGNQYRKNLEVLEVEKAELERFALTRTPDKWPSSLPFMDSNHPCFAPELNAAVSAWMALFSAGDTSKLSPPDQIKRWLKKHQPTLSKAAIERLSVVANYKKTRGPKKIRLPYNSLFPRWFCGLHPPYFRITTT